ncbi:hypothetical protein [Nocardioides sp. CFH 31398]|uniref:hypothetical protein n=1 Tax=Nocardioides sp. CFH 31398 TaxID=2919579 RepID=UPI001F058396|nr:hypothetical protein [Nocardioides sp. CFH 31398]MCH1865407.1 hypothetical protein [Nocardioides sp. CFH 31398]
MADAQQFAAEVERAVADTPYMVADETPDGFTVQIDVVDAQWWTLMQRKSLKKSFSHIVKVAPDGTYTVTDRSMTVEWQAGAELAGGVPRPVLRATAGMQQGNVREISFRKEIGIDDSGRPGEVVDYTFASGEGNAIIEAAADRLGLRKTMNTSAKVGLGVAGLVIGALVVVGIVVAILALTGVLG